MSLATVKQLHALGFLETMDVQVAKLASRVDPQANDLSLLAAALASHAISLGHACANLEDYTSKTWKDVLQSMLTTKAYDRTLEVTFDSEKHESMGSLPPTLTDWTQSLSNRLFGHGSETKKDRTLFIHDEGRVYLRRYWDYERNVEHQLIGLKSQATGLLITDRDTEGYFKQDQVLQVDATRKALGKRLSLLSGGPGTGKTYTMARAVALLNARQGNRPHDLVVRMAAPTGKAAVRMVESIKKAKRDLLEDLQRQGHSVDHLNAIPEEATTLHRLLGVRYHSPYFKHGARDPICADMVIVDEASMVDLPLMAKLLDALPEHCSLMLVGDTDQLASVEPGRVYGDVCKAAEPNGPLADCLTRLTQSWRFPDHSVIGAASRLINEGKADEAWNALQSKTVKSHFQLCETNHLNEQNEEFVQLVRQNMQPFVDAKDAISALKAAGDFRILCALRHGPHGVATLNRYVENILAKMGMSPRQGVYDHQLIMINVNTPSQNLFNGDVGIILAKESDKNAFEAWFPDPEHGARSLPVGLLPDFETAFAMTVHKAQGSEFPNVAFILPDRPDSPILTRELLYTGLTRVAIDAGKENGKLTLWCTEKSFKAAVDKKTSRTTGLFKTVPKS